MGQLSGKGQKVLNAFQKLSPQDRAEIIAHGATALAAEVANAALTAAPNTRAKAQASLTQEVAERLITKAGGIFLGEKQLKELGVIDKDATIPPIPEKFSRAFLNAAHPLRGGSIKMHIILGFDPETDAWDCFEKSIVPGSLGKDGTGLSGPEQDMLLLGENGQPRMVGEMKYSSPTDCQPIQNVLENVKKLQCNDGANVEDLPFYGTYSRTADTQRADPGCRVLVGYSSLFDSYGCIGDFSADVACPDCGLIAGWS